MQQVLIDTSSKIDLGRLRLASSCFLCYINVIVRNYIRVVIMSSSSFVLIDLHLTNDLLLQLKFLLKLFHHKPARHQHLLELEILLKCCHITFKVVILRLKCYSIIIIWLYCWCQLLKLWLVKIECGLKLERIIGCLKSFSTLIIVTDLGWSAWVFLEFQIWKCHIIENIWCEKTYR